MDIFLKTINLRNEKYSQLNLNFRLDLVKQSIN